MIQYRNLSDLNQSILDNLHRIPRDIDIVVGIPRSGLLPASLIALYLNLPLADLEGFLIGRLMDCGRTRRPSNCPEAADDCQKALIIDDSVRTGKTLASARQKIETSSVSQEILYAAVYAAPEAEKEVDLAFEICPVPRIFEWNFMHHGELRNACIDIDGVLCRDPTATENDDGARYEKLLQACEPLLLPSVPVGHLVTCRLEKYRPQTEHWLRRHGVQYEELVMMNLPTKAARVAARTHGAFKADVYRQTGAQLFIESSLKQAVEVADRSRKPVLCMETREMIYPSLRTTSKRALDKLPGSVHRWTQSALTRLGRWLMRYVAE